MMTRPELGKTMNKATLAARFQIAIPKDICVAQDWTLGQEFVFLPKGNGVLLMPLPKLEDMKGLAAGTPNRAVRDRDNQY